ALATPHWSRSRNRLDDRSRGRGRRARIILPVVDISVYHAVIIPVGPYRAGKSADRGANHRAGQDAAAGQRTGRGADRSSAKRPGSRAGEHAVRVRIIASRRAGVILTVVHIAVDIAVIVAVGPGRAGETADR